LDGSDVAAGSVRLRRRSEMLDALSLNSEAGSQLNAQFILVVKENISLGNDKPAMRKRIAIILGTVSLLLLAGAALLLIPSGEAPQVRLLRLSPLEGETGNPEAHLENEDAVSALLAAVPNVGSPSVVAQFEISVSQVVGYCLAPEPLPYEFRGAGGAFIGSGSWEFPLIFGSQGRCPNTFRPRLTVPAATESVFLRIHYKRPTMQERSMMMFEKWGLRKRHSKVCDWISRRLPGKEHWSIHEEDVKLVPSPHKIE
jgi:hypothetical protein